MNVAYPTLNFNLGADIDMLRDSLYRFLQAELAPRAAAIDQANEFPSDMWRKFGDLGLLGITIDERYGGSGMGYLAHVVAMEEISRASASVGLSYGANSNLCMNQIARNGSEAQKQRYLPGIATGEIRFQAFGVSEPTTGSDTTQLKTRAVRDGDHYVVNGQKIWTSRAHKSDLMMLLVRTTPADQVKRRSEGLSVLLVEMADAVGKGLTMRRIDTMINHQTNEVFFDDLRVPVENRIGEENLGFRYILDGMNAERVLTAAESLGDARYFIERASKYASERVVFGRPIGQNQGVQFPIARAYAEWRAADLMVRAAAALFDAGKPCGEEANTAKLLASEAAWNAAEAAMQTFGGFSAAREFDIERKWRDCRLQRIAPISTNLILAYLGQHVLGMPRSY
jgi:acyl-CoA dehydrogenase